MSGSESIQACTYEIKRADHLSKITFKFSSLDNSIVDLFEGANLASAKPLVKSSVEAGQEYSSEQKVVVMLVVPSQATNKVELTFSAEKTSKTSG